MGNVLLRKVTQARAAADSFATPDGIQAVSCGKKSLTQLAAARIAAMLLLIDNYDSFVHNVARYFERLGQPTLVVRNDAIEPEEISALAPEAIVLSPGPCTPSEAGCSLDVVRQYAGQIPILGVCLGHQVIGAAFGASIVRASSPMHGRASHIRHDGQGLFAGLPSPLAVGRYHSLAIHSGTLPDAVQVTARVGDDVIMAIAHRQWPVFGVQFHPESILTEGGYDLLSNFLRLAGIPVTSLPHGTAERAHLSTTAAPAVPLSPVTF